MRTTQIAAGALLLIVMPVMGCGNLGDIFDLFQPSQTTVQLVNSSSTFSVEVELYYHDDQNVLEAIIGSVGTERNFTIPAGQTRQFSVDCDELQAIIIEDANLMVAGEIGPDQDTDVFRDGDEFNCGDTVVFTFSHPTLPTSLNIDFSTR